MIFFSSDEHFSHANVIKYCNRPYSSVDEMNEDMVTRWNSMVGPNDTVYVLGDFSLGFKSVEMYSWRLNGKRYLVPGNHDQLHSFHKKSRNLENQQKWIQKYKDYGWNVLPEQTHFTFEDGTTVNVCHHPYSTKYELENDDKYDKWRPKDDGKVLLCGHVHEKWLTNRSPAGTLMINVGVDVNNFFPVSAEELLKNIKMHSNE